VSICVTARTVAHERLVNQATNVVKGPEEATEFRSVMKRRPRAG
jgi:hypothetical protein